MFFACGLYCVANVSSFSPSSEQTGLTLETSAIHQTPQAKSIQYQPLLIKPILNRYGQLYFSSFSFTATVIEFAVNILLHKVSVVLSPGFLVKHFTSTDNQYTTIDNFRITLQFPRTITWSRGFVREITANSTAQH